ncbi:MAG: hypothetical protein WCP06_10715 [Verrucomicrobiota bacterium]
MQLTDEQKQEVSRWIAEGAKLSEVQQRLDEQFGIRLTYMEARFLVDDLKLVPQEKPEPPAKAEPPQAPSSPTGGEPKPGAPDEVAGKTAAGGSVKISMDQIMRPGSLVSGSVVFSDGVKAEWYLDQTGRFGLVPPQPGYRPSQADLAEFRILLEEELSRQGM